MILKRFYDDKLAQASYLIGCVATGEAVVIDANRDTDQYIRVAEAEGVEITHVTETHIHADYVSGSRELAERTGAKLYLSDEGGPDWKYRFARDYDAVLLHDGDRIEVGNVALDVLHTPGHTPEHLSFVVTDRAAADKPIGILTGDFVFVGDVGRPDLLEKAAKIEGTMVDGARTLFRSLQRFRALDDYIQVWPGHGAGSACGKGLSAIPQSTVGYERQFNWAFGIDDEDGFVEAVLADQPEPPKYFAEMKRINRDGPRVLNGFHRPSRLPEPRLEKILRNGSVIIDTRHASDYAAGHVPGTINIPLNRSFTTWAGWLVPYEEDFYLLINDTCTHCLDEAVRDLAMIGLDRVAGYFGAEAIEAWESSGFELERTQRITGEELRSRLDADEELKVVDVRGAAEWKVGHLPSAENIPVGYLPEHLQELPRTTPLVVHCQSGGRSALAASVLQANGFTNVLDYSGGFSDWQDGGGTVETGERAVAGVTS